MVAANPMEVRSDPLESAKSHLFDTSSWGAYCDVTLTLKQAFHPDSGGWVRIDDYRCRQAFRHFINLLNRAVFGAAFRRYGKRLRVLPVLEKGEVGARALRSCDRGTWVRADLDRCVDENWRAHERDQIRGRLLARRSRVGSGRPRTGPAFGCHSDRSRPGVAWPGYRIGHSA